MDLHSLSVRRPVFTSVVSIFIVLVGLLGLNSLGIREYPAIDPAVVSVSVTWRGANAEVMENQVTEPLEQALNGIDGVRSISSQSSDGRTRISVEFELGVDLERAANDVRDKVSRAERSLPDDADAPVVSKADANSSPIVIFALTGDPDLLHLSALAGRIQERLQTVPGVSEVRIFGEKRYSMRIRLDPVRMSAHGVSVEMVRAALERENTDLPAGELEGSTVTVSLRAETGLRTVDDFRQVAIRSADGKFVRIADVADVSVAPENERTALRLGGAPGVALAVVAQPGSNQVSISDEVHNRVAAIKQELPKGIQLDLAFDNTRFVRAALSEVEETIAFSFLLVVVVIFAFLRDWRTTLIPVLTVPVSLIGSFAFLWWMGFSINVLTLLGTVLAVGLVVDDAIVVLENIYARVEEGLKPFDAAIVGLRQIFFAVVSTTLVLCAVFTPLLFLEGFTGRLFREFAISVGGAVLVSGFVALTLGGSMSARLLRPHGQDNRLHHATEPFFVGMTTLYERLLARWLKRPWLAVPVLVSALILIFVLWPILPKELSPIEDRSTIQIPVKGHEGATYPWMDDYMRRLEAVVRDAVPEADVTLVQVSSGYSSVNSGNMRIQLVPAEERSRSQQEIVQALFPLVSALPGARASVVQEQSIRSGGGRASQPVQMVIQAPDLQRLKQVLPEFLDSAQASSVLVTPETDLTFTKPQLELSVDRDRLRDLGVSPVAVAQTLQASFGGEQVGYYLKDGKQYPVIVEVERSQRSEPASLDAVRLQSTAGLWYPLSSLVSMREIAVPPQLPRYNRWVSATVSAGLATDATLGDGIAEMRRIAHAVLGPEFRTELTGSSRDFEESSSNLLAVFLGALLVVFLLLAAQFESLRHPFVILLTVPLALVGALLSLWIGGFSLSIFGQIGMVLLVGLVTKNGILIVEFANQKLESGLALREAILDAASARLRPILMTSLATVLGILPVALALGAGAESRVPMGVGIIAGILSSLALTLFVVPAMYLLLSPKRLKVSHADG